MGRRLIVLMHDADLPSIRGLRERLDEALAIDGVTEDTVVTIWDNERRGRPEFVIEATVPYESLSVDELLVQVGNQDYDAWEEIVNRAKGTEDVVVEDAGA